MGKTNRRKKLEKKAGGDLRIRDLERELLRPRSWPPQNPKAATARFLLVKELARLKNVKIKEIKRWLEENYASDR